MHNLPSLAQADLLVTSSAASASPGWTAHGLATTDPRNVAKLHHQSQPVDQPALSPVFSDLGGVAGPPAPRRAGHPVDGLHGAEPWLGLFWM